MKKEKKDGAFLWQRVFLIMVGVLFIGMMIISATGPSWLQSFRSVRANDTVTIDFTLRDAMGRPVLTTDQNLYLTGLSRGYPVFLSSPLTLRAGYIGNPPFTGVQAENYYMSQSGQKIRFGILGRELDELDAGVLGMKTGETKTIHFTFNDSLIISLKTYEFTAIGGNFTETMVGDIIPLGFSEAPMVLGMDEVNSTPTNPVFRIATVINKTGSSIDVMHRYPSADITVKEFK